MVTQWYPTLSNPWATYSLPSSSVHEILQARILWWVAIPFSRGSSPRRDQIWAYPHFRQILYHLSHQGSSHHPLFGFLSHSGDNRVLSADLSGLHNRFSLVIYLYIMPIVCLCQYQPPTVSTKALDCCCQWLSHVSLFVTPWTAGHQASLSFTISRSLLELMSIESMMPFNHLVLCHPLLFLPSIFPSVRVFSNDSALRIRWPKFWSFGLSISPSNEYSGLISFMIDWFDPRVFLHIFFSISAFQMTFYTIFVDSTYMC